MESSISESSLDAENTDFIAAESTVATNDKTRSSILQKGDSIQHRDDEADPVDLAPPSPPIPSFRKMMFPVDPAAALQRPKVGSARLLGRKQEPSRPEISTFATRTKTKYELFREKKYMKNYKSSLSDIQKRQEKNKPMSLRFNIGDSDLESNLTIAALNSDHLSIFEEQPEQGQQESRSTEASDRRTKEDAFDLQTFLDGLKKPKVAVKILKASRVDELKARIEEFGSVVEGLSKEECLYYIETFVSIDTDASGAISEAELFEAMDTLNMDVTVEKVKEMISSVDVNGNGDVSVDEFLKLMAAVRRKITFLQSNEQMKFAFDLVDRDQDGLIGIQDLLTLFEEIGEKEIDFYSCKKMLHAVIGESYAIKKSEDPKVNIEQFCRLVKAIGE